ncbi:DUF2165 family protein [Pantoea agglomerans]|uniref:DUF2165 family protein n=1 Tax=Enterobacter agglomerans TaxID=549 RepID=A0A7X2MJA8_ENTAG|nr:DUF2165 family protein [Pantoea agglomerans]KEY40325.1 hypothetical protein FB99_45450 [Pantoea agglomerans]MCL6413069.1 DUF2165 family protein [Pantoea agglomerans]MSE14156.1 DUF2165 family protein [Pantoea agglomerans]QAV47406.1 DUF2165 family protein [Pantoea agglomerans]QAV52063.1 DUF2165 family protein [Pantoea agglomerans]
MLTLSGINVIKVIVISGLALWNLLEGLGLVKDFTGAQKMVGRIMNMEMIEAPPAVPTNLITRRVGHPFWHKSGAAVLVLFNFSCALLLLIAVSNIFREAFSPAGIESFIEWGNYGLAVFITMGFSLSFVGLWFAYYIKQSELMITHFLLIILGVVVAGFINLS